MAQLPISPPPRVAPPPPRGSSQQAGAGECGEGPESAGRARAQCRFLLSGLPGMDGSTVASSLQADTAVCPELAGSSASVAPSLVLPRPGAGERAGPRACAPGGSSGSTCGVQGARVAQWGWLGLGDCGAGLSLSQLSGGGAGHTISLRPRGLASPPSFCMCSLHGAPRPHHWVPCGQVGSRRPSFTKACPCLALSRENVSPDLGTPSPFS